MKGSYWKQGNRYIVGFWYQGKQWKISRYMGEPMWHEKYAIKCLSMIQGRMEQAQQGLCRFRIEEFTRKGWTDVIDYFEKWMEKVIEPKRKPATVKGYWSYYRNWIRPFFEKYPVMLHEIQLDTLTSLLNFIKGSGKHKMNVMMSMHSMMDYAWRSKRIPEVPAFPKREDYNIVEPTIKWLTEDRQMIIIEAIPEKNRSIFLWLKYHLRRPGEACVLKWKDYDAINRVFIIRRSLSARKVTESTKTHVEHVVPCHPDFEPIIKNFKPSIGNYIFQNPRARKDGKRYTNESLNILWRRACEKVGEKIDLYSGLKHSSCSQYINEKRIGIHDLQKISGHKRIDSVRKYAAYDLDTVRGLMATTSKTPKLKIIGRSD